MGRQFVARADEFRADRCRRLRLRPADRHRRRLWQALWRSGGARPAGGLHDNRPRRAGTGADPAALFRGHRPHQPRAGRPRLRPHRHQRPRRRHLGAGLRPGRLCHRGHPRRHPVGAAGPDRGGARLWHVAGQDAAAHHPACHVALRHSGPRQPVAHRHQGHGPAGDRRIQRTDPGNPHGRGPDQGLFHLLHGCGCALSGAHAGLERCHRADRALVAGAACHRSREAANERSAAGRHCRRDGAGLAVAAAAPHRADR